MAQNRPTPKPMLLRDFEAAAILGCGRTTIWNLSAAGEIAFVKLGKSRRFVASSVEGYAERLIAEQAEKRAVAQIGRE
jgi:excisionase family DNA binding protein